MNDSLPMPIRAIRIPEQQWRALQAAAHNEGRNASDIIRELIDKHLSKENK